MGSTKHLFRWLLVMGFITSAILKAEQTPKPDVYEIVARMENARNQAKDTGPFLLMREYRLFRGNEANPMSEVKAEIKVNPPRDRDFKIVDAKGNSRGTGVVKKILEHETKAEKETPSPTAIISENYDFSLEGEYFLEGAHCYVLKLRPKRDETGLIEGRAWVDSQSYLVRRVEGEMAKSPSWWVKKVKVTISFGEMGGVWTQMMTDAVADVRIVGMYTVTGRATSVQTAEAVAANEPQKDPMGRKRTRSVPAEVIYSPSVVIPK